MSWFHSPPLPLDSDRDTIETLRELQRMTCARRGFISISGAAVSVHFELLEDAVSFFDAFSFFLEMEDQEPPSGGGRRAGVELEKAR